MSGRHGVTGQVLPPVEAKPSVTRSETNALSGPITVPRRVLLADTGFEAHPLALGGSVFGWTLGPHDAEAVLDRFAALGGSIVDTADSYASGRSERIVGRWMASRRTRDRLVLTTKVGRLPERRGLAPETLRAAVDDSLERLGTDVVDVLYLHGEDPGVPLEETLGAVGALIDAGKVRVLGASDFSPERLIEARVLAANGLPRIQLVTTRYNLMDRRPFEGAPELVAHAQGLGVLPYFALANGFLAGQVRRRAEVRHDARGARLARHLGRRGHRVLAAIDEIAFARDVQPATVAITWLLSRPTVVAPVAGVSRPEQVEALLAAGALDLHRSELVELDRASA
ncbi:aldo/keto reductase [Agromyces aerolatus]|uniref:aldo/keto reductase n=1 Tax=Agromyces sp. LY-1074 TaxID=3074080 RepID=UPI0028668177|nr:MULTISPECIES: aldo/keto reductase [unclassified Agromyces]MDR5701042.1 aldo/keto reductase [Agromyces sp. LY-1074]MDR5707682.1 aldo/keto reductase [Agromyces sp. LY-1358]